MAFPDPEIIPIVRMRIQHWYRANARSFVWRSSSDPYLILVSEIMLQQTQVARVEQKLPLFLKKFPDIAHLARATKADVVRAWQGMGYNSRALRLRELAGIVVERLHGALPDDAGELQKLPGIGPYTSHAVACFAFRKRVPLVDVNIRRVLSRLFWKMRSPEETIAEPPIWEMAAKVLPRDAHSWNQGLMDFGSLVCTLRNPSCRRCPVRVICKSPHLENSRSRPARPPKADEPRHAGIPRRIWRGRIVEQLRHVSDHRRIAIFDLGRSVKSDFTAADIPWLEQILALLERDGIITVTGRKQSASIRLSRT
jgi:A/G-specific adenine glycosylase